MFENLRLMNRLKWVLSLLLRPILKLEIIIYKKFFSKNKNKKTRLFITTGNISLINTLALIKQLKNNSEDYDDILIICSGGKNDFMDRNIEMAQLHNFKKILPIFNLRFTAGFVLLNLFNIDEIFTVNHPAFLGILKLLYGNTDINLIDEGCASLINYDLDNFPNLKNFYTHKYLNKLDGLGFSDKTKDKIKNIDVNIFKNTAKQISEKYPIITPYNKEDKNILYCGIYWLVSGLNKEAFAQEQKQLILDLLNAGYKVLYKPHPRDTDFYGFDKNPNVTFIQSYLPVELYPWDILAVVSMSSTASIHLAHYWNIPGFSDVVDQAVASNEKDDIALYKIRRMVKEYSPNYKQLLNYDVNDMSKEELKQTIKENYDKFINSKPLLSENRQMS